MYLWTNDLANQGKSHMEKKNVSFSKDGMKVGVKEMSEEEYADRTQRCVLFPPLPRDTVLDTHLLDVAERDVVSRLLHMLTFHEIACWSILGARVLSRHTRAGFGTRKSRQRIRLLLPEEHEKVREMS
jgi:hypothetical protein